MGFESLNGEQRRIAPSEDEGLGSGGTKCGTDSRGGAKRESNLQNVQAVESVAVEVLELDL
jgi:hypothetical protein